VRFARSDGLIGVFPAAPAEQRRLVECLGASYHAVVGDDIPTALVGSARAEHVARLVLGVGRCSCWSSCRLDQHRRYRHPPDGRGDIDVHMVTRELAAIRQRRPVLRTGLSPRRRLAGALTGLVVLPLLTLGLAQLRDIVNMPSQTLLYLLAVVVVALVGGLLPALVAAVAAAMLLDHYFIPPLYDFAVADSHNVVALVAFVGVGSAASSVVGLAARRREAEALATANAESREELRVLADEQAALRRVAMLVARGLPPAEVFAAVAQEVGHVLGADASTIVRLDPDGAVTVLARVGENHAELPVGSRWTLEPPGAMATVLRTGRPARCDDYSQASGAFVDATVRRMGIRSSVAAPIVVEGRLWGAIVAGVRHGRFPADTEQRMAGFTELVGTAIANADSRAELRVLAEEQAALRRVATLVARGVSPSEVFVAVAAEFRRLLDVYSMALFRYEPDGTATLVSAHNEPGVNMPAETPWSLEGENVAALVLRTGRAARMDSHDGAPGWAAARIRELGIYSGVGAPIVVEGHLWGVAIVGSRRPEPLPPDTEARMVGFTELVGTAIANADSRAQLTASRARIVAAADDARRRVERDLHDGTQQRLVSLSLGLRLARSTVPADLPGLQTQIGRVADELDEASAELREISHGIHPAILSEGGLRPALRTLARRSVIPVELDVRTDARFRDPIEVAAYYVVSEALTNTTKHARASCAHVAVDQRAGVLHLSIRDDGVGGADPARGSGLTGLRDRVEALGGSIEVSSRPGDGTLIVVDLPLQPD
jgi:signal transduction histidine kinase